MDATNEHVVEDSKYAFLLGSALREEDFDQVFKIYDDLIPKDITENRLQEIKEGARQVSELPEDEFNSLVLNARTFSLASARISMSHSSGGQVTVPPLDIADMDGSGDDQCPMLGKHNELTSDGSGDHHRVPHFSSYGKCSQVSDSKQPGYLISEAKTRYELSNTCGGEEVDSGLADSLPAQSGESQKTSVSNVASSIDEEEVDSGDERAGVFDYTPCRPRKNHHVRITPTYNPQFDEEVRVCSSAGGSSVESPRSETSVTHDEYSLLEEGATELTTFYRKSRPYTEEYTEDNDRAFNSHKSLYSKQRTQKKEDKHRGMSWDYSSGKLSDAEMDDDDSQVPQRSSYSPNFTPSARKPTEFDDRISMFDNSSRKLHQKTNIYSYNMINSPMESSSSNKKKKGRSKDDSDAHLDLNGNPVTRENYAQMRQSPGGPKSDGGSILAISPGSTAGPEGMQHNELDKKRMRKQKRLEKNQYTKASSETIQDFKGDKSLDDLLLFLGEKKTVVNSSDSTSGVKLSKKKQKLVNGQAPVPQKDTVDDGPKKEIVTPKGKFSAMGNNAGREGDVSLEIVNPSEINEEKDKGNNEFHDCLNSVPKESLNFNFATNVKVNENLNTKPHSDSSKPLKIDINTKKSQRHKTNKREKSEVSKSHGIQSNTVNHEQNDFHLDFPMDFSDDFQPFKREETFTEVKKKKKKTPVKENNLPNHYSTNNVQPYVSSSFYQPRANGSSYRPSQRPRASSPPPVQDGSYDEPSLPSTEHSSPRDLSPSAFPVLSGHSPSGLRVEGRRNSCGDINPENLDNKVLYDSDRESVQSLPGANGTEQSSDNYSVYPVSYARIAAASKRGYESTNSPSSESGVVSGSHNSSVSSSIFHTPGSSAEASSPLSPTDTVVSTPDRKTTVWKGSPRERRHSIGSSPEDMVEADMTGITHRSRQKSGSTEFLVRDGSPVPTQDGIIRSASPPVKNILTISNNDSIDEICLSKDGSHTDLIKPQSYESIMISDKQGSVSSVSAHLIENKDSVVQTDNKDLSSHTNIVTVENDNNMSSCAESIDRKSVSNNVSTKSSVVFLDKRFDTKPKKTLGITFGFGDDDVDNTSSLENTSSQDKLGSNKQQKTVASTTKHSHQSSLQVSSHLSSAKYSKPPTHIPSSSSNQLSTSISQSTSSHQSSQINHSDNSKQSINKETCNGVIVPSDVVSQQKMHTTAAQSSTNSSISGAVRTPTHRPPQPVPALPAVPRLPMIGGVVFSPNHPPPPLPVHHASQFQPIPAHIVPPALPKENNSNQIHTDSNTDFPTLKSATTKSPKDKGLGGPVGQSPIPSPSKSSSATERVNAAASASSPDSPLRVVYGLKIKPEGGCGVLLFRPPIYKESRRGKSSEASGFLKKKWNHITDPTNKKNSQVFITVSDT